MTSEELCRNIPWPGEKKYEEFPMPSQILKPGTLWKSVTQRTASALRCGALRPLPTTSEHIHQANIAFRVHVLAPPGRTPPAERKPTKYNVARGGSVNPFLPYEKELFVANLSPTHVCLLNKFPGIAHHVLILPRAFEEQQAPLTMDDFEALWTCMAEYEGLGFYNGGRRAGASQRHKHLQVIPLPFTQTGLATPIEPALERVVYDGTIGSSPAFPFVHAVAKLHADSLSSPARAARITYELYHTMLRAVGVRYEKASAGKECLEPYNMLITRRWMFLVPRSKEDYAGISVNALGFAGALLVSNAAQLALLKHAGPLTALTHVAIPSPTSRDENRSRVSEEESG